MPEPLPTSHLRLVEPPPAPPASAPGWIDLKEAARRSGWGEGYLRRRCSDDKRCATWRSAGLARMEAPPQGGPPRWLVHESADAKLAPVKTAGQLSESFDERTLTDEQRAVLHRRERCVLDLERAIAEATARGVGIEQAVETTAARLDVSGRNLRRWVKDYRTAGIACLVDGRWQTVRAAAEPPAQDPFLLEVQRLYLDQRKRSMQLCYDAAKDEAAANGWRVCSYRTAARFLKRIPSRAVALHRHGDAAYAAASPCITRDYTTIDTNDVWLSDHHRLDVSCTLPDGSKVRPWLTCWMDMRSRRLVAWSVYGHSPNAAVILATFKFAVEQHGKPRRVYIDNGKDYDSFCLQGLTKQQRLRRDLKRQVEGGGVFGRLGVAVMHAAPYSPRSKAPVERFFGTVRCRFSQLFETYCGNSPQAKPEDLPEQLARGKAPPASDVAAHFDDWLDADYHHKPHTGDGLEGRTPIEVFALTQPQKRPVLASLLEELTLERTKPLLVGPNGVRWRGVYYGRNEPALIPREGRQDRKVSLAIDHADLSLVRVYDAADGRWLCIARVNQKLPVLADDQMLREAIAQQRRDRKTAKAYHQVRPRLSMSLTDHLQRQARLKREQQAPTPPDGGPTLVPVRHELEDQLPAIRAALDSGKLRPAVGAESLHFRDLLNAGVIGRAMEEEREKEELPDTFSILAEAMRKNRAED